MRSFETGFVVTIALLRIAVALLVVSLVTACSGAPGAREPAGGVSSAEIEVRALRQVDGEWRAELVPSAGSDAVTLRAGDPIADGSVVAVGEPGLFVEVQWDSDQKRLLRFMPSDEPPAIALGPETTRITSPLLPDGTPDYGAWLNQEYGAGVTQANNAAPALQAALGGLVAAGYTFWDGVAFAGVEAKASPVSRITGRPWVDEDCPQCLLRLEQNERVLSRIAEAARRPRYYRALPAGSRLYLVRFPSLLPMRLSSNAFAGRGMLRLGRGDVGGAAEDALTLQRLALGVAQGAALIEPLIGIAVRGIGAPLLPSIAASPALDADGARALLDELGKLPPLTHTSETVDRGERYFRLDRILLMRERASSRGPGGLFEILEPPETRDLSLFAPPPLLYLVRADAVDWDAALRQTSRLVELQLAALGARTLEERRGAHEAFEAEEERIKEVREAVAAELARNDHGREPEALGRAAALDRLAASAEGRRRLAALTLEPEGILRVSLSWNEAQAQFRLGVLAVALAAHRLEHGGFPARLADVALPDPLAPEPLGDPSPGYRIGYRPGPVGSRGDGLHGSFALTAVPVASGETGVRGFCVDSTGAMVASSDGSAEPLPDGSCGAERAPTP